MSVHSLEQRTLRKIHSEPAPATARQPNAAVRYQLPDDRRYAAAKRICDVLGALLLIVAALPCMLLIAALIKLDSPGPILFRQMRCGRNHKPFVILKFRTMEARPSCDGRQATRDDRRVTRVGRFLRKSSLDEVPQIFNVLRGDMSLVGPRPHALWHDKIYCELIGNYRDRYLVKPGITGLAQISGCRGETSTKLAMQRRVEKDLEYLENRSLALDLKILLLTLPSLLLLRDAY